MVTGLLTTSSGARADLASIRRLRRERDADRDPASPTAATEVLTLRHREAMLAGGRPEDLLALATAVDAAVTRFPTWPDLRLLRADLALAVHRPDIAAASVHAVPGLASLPPGLIVLADVAMSSGDYRAADSGYRKAARDDPRWDTTARQAALAVATGACAEGDDRYARAEDDLTAKQLRAFAWVRVQRADLALALGDPDRAERLLTDADTAYPGWWYVGAHRAALALELGRWEEAVDGYRSVLAEADRSEFREALGRAFAGAGATDCAAECFALALSGYLASVARAEVHHLHHLAAFHTDVRPYPWAAVAWATEDADLRRNGTTLSLLAWCLHRAGRREEAMTVLDEAFAMGAGDPRLRARAAAIRQGGRS
jgi:tetratricopeptide (TPR) repeat protein